MLDAWPNFIATVVALPILFLAAERIAPAERCQPARRLLFNLVYGPFYYAFALFALLAATPVFLFVIRQTDGGLLPAFGGAGSSVAAQILLALTFAFFWDLSQYCLHRLQHASPFLWETHRFHHEETALNASTYTRGHFLGSLGAVAFYVPLVALLGTQAPNAIAGFVLFPVWGFFAHSNLRIGFGPLTPLIVAPQWHRIHHSALPEHRDTNFAALFPIIDIAFGTYYRPAADEYPPTGTDGEPVGNLRGATVQPLIAWWLMARHWTSRLMVVDRKPL